MDGRRTAELEKKKLKQKINKFYQQKSYYPGLAVLLTGEDPASRVYVQQKIKACKEVGIVSELLHIPVDTPLEKLQKQIQELNCKPEIHAVLIQLPLPSSWPVHQIMSWLNPLKDPDGLTVENQGLFWTGRPRVLPCTPAGILKLLRHYQIPLEGKKAVVVGRSQIVGMPMARLLIQANATVSVCHSYTKNLSALTGSADLVVSAAGKPGFLGKADFKEGAIAVDVGIHRAEGSKKLIGDLRFNELKDHLSFVTPVPGGVGPMTVLMLLENTFQLAVSQADQQV